MGAPGCAEELQGTLVDLMVKHSKMCETALKSQFATLLLFVHDESLGLYLGGFSSVKR